MNSEKQFELCDTFPHLFYTSLSDVELERRAKGPRSEICTYVNKDGLYLFSEWGFQCGDGWYQLIKDTCERITVVSCQYQINVRIYEVKQKFRELRIGLSGVVRGRDEGSKKIIALIDSARSASSAICEECGKAGSPRFNQTLCDHCHEHNY